MSEMMKIKRTPKVVTVSERNLQSAAVRLLPKHNKLVSTEVEYLRRVLGDKATQGEIDEKVIAVRKLPWRELVSE
jgi:uroporphyrinogen-III synthase